VSDQTRSRGTSSSGSARVARKRRYPLRTVGLCGLCVIALSGCSSGNPFSDTSRVGSINVDNVIAILTTDNDVMGRLCPSGLATGSAATISAACQVALSTEIHHADHLSTSLSSQHASGVVGDDVSVINADVHVLDAADHGLATASPGQLLDRSNAQADAFTQLISDLDQTSSDAAPSQTPVVLVIVALVFLCAGLLAALPGWVMRSRKRPATRPPAKVAAGGDVGQDSPRDDVGQDSGRTVQEALLETLASDYLRMRRYDRVTTLSQGLLALAAILGLIIAHIA